MKLRFALLFVLGTAALAQTTPQPAELQAVLNLSDAQVQSLIGIRQQLPQSLQPVLATASQKQQALQQLLQSNAPDPAAVGSLVIALNNLGQQVQQIVNDSQAQSLAVLTQDQASKLQVLAQALQLQSPAAQAVALGLLNAPDPPAGQASAQSRANGNKLMLSFPGNRASR